jgi:hypothetical protein
VVSDEEATTSTVMHAIEGEETAVAPVTLQGSTTRAGSIMENHRDPTMGASLVA